ncbi:hypothetical protein ACR3F4_001773 [Escherichia coli]|nr:hypothetical protein [Escherichia coli]EEW1376544.1 hypothetical protein [Escherichia coli]EFJ9495145.1 hypothetical protein [Escherichia coli]EIM4606599.1 hypothetical protein [Escherichia coli]EIO6641009.1 hypothetical protein [Escherichia coli]
MCQHGLPEYVSVILRWWLCLSGMTDTAPLVLWCCGAVVLWCCGAVVLAGCVTFTGVM